MHLGPKRVLLAIHKGGPFISNSLLLLTPLLRDYFTLLQILLLSLLLQIGEGDQAKKGFGRRRRGRGEIVGCLRLRNLFV